MYIKIIENMFKGVFARRIVWMPYLVLYIKITTNKRNILIVFHLGPI